MKLKKRINIEILSKSLTRHVPVIQNDRGRIIECYITDCQIPTGTKVKFWAMKPSGKLVYNDCTLKDNVVSIELTNQTLAEKGLVACQLEFDGDVSSYEFFLDVERDISGNGMVSENESTVLDAILEEMRVAIANVKSETEKAKVATAEAKKATEEAIKATQESQNPIKEVKGSDITADGTFQGSDIIKELKGGTKQRKTNGYQLFDASKLPTKSAGGATVTNNGDGSFTISGSGNITENINYYYEFTREEALKLLKVGTLTLNTGYLSYPLVGVLIHSNSHFTELNSVSSENVSAEITQDMLDANDLSFRLRFYAALGHAIVPGTIKPMLYQDGDGTWEPFTGGEPSPNPDYPQFIHGLGDMGYFDGELIRGNIDSSIGSTTSTSSTYLRCVNSIQCKFGDVIKIKYEEVLACIKCAFYKENGTLAETPVKQVVNNNVGEFTAPEETAYFMFSIQKGSSIDFPVSSAKHITVTINGKYAVKVKTHGKNLFSGKVFKQKLLYAGGYERDGGIFITAERMRTITFFDNFKENTQYTIVLDGYNVSESNYDFANMTIYYTDGTYYVVRHGAQHKRTQNATKSALGKTIEKIKGSWESGGNIFYPEGCGIFEGDITVEDFKSYKLSTAYIPLDYPLYEGDRIYLEDGELWEYRENGWAVFDGSMDEYWIVTQYNNLCAYIGNINMNILDNAEIRKTVKCNKFKTHPQNITGNVYKENGIAIEGMNESYSGFFFGIYGLATDVPTWRTWLQQNPLEVVYKLKEPTLKKLGSVEAFNLRTFDERTYIEVVGSKELGTENTFIVPRNQSGGLITDAFATSKRNEINAAGQANLASRISALEQLAVKESV